MLTKDVGYEIILFFCKLWIDLWMTLMWAGSS